MTHDTTQAWLGHDLSPVTWCGGHHSRHRAAQPGPGRLRRQQQVRHTLLRATKRTSFPRTRLPLGSFRPGTPESRERERPDAGGVDRSLRADVLLGAVVRFSTAGRRQQPPRPACASTARARKEACCADAFHRVQRWSMRAMRYGCRRTAGSWSASAGMRRRRRNSWWSSPTASAGRPRVVSAASMARNASSTASRAGRTSVSTSQPHRYGGLRAGGRRCHPGASGRVLLGRHLDPRPRTRAVVGVSAPVAHPGGEGRTGRAGTAHCRDRGDRPRHRTAPRLADEPPRPANRSGAARGSDAEVDEFRLQLSPGREARGRRYTRQYVEHPGRVQRRRFRQIRVRSREPVRNAAIPRGPP